MLFTLPQDELPQVAAAHEAAATCRSRSTTATARQQLGKGKLAVIDNQINQTTATMRLKALVPNPDRTLWPNAFVKARMLVETRKDALVVPAVAVQRGPQGTFVYVVGAGQDRADEAGRRSRSTTGDDAIVDKGVDGRRAGRHRRAEPAAARRQGRSARRPRRGRRRRGHRPAAGPTAVATEAPE